MKISRNFSRHEFACKCGCGFDTVDVALIITLQKIRDNFNRSITITSGCRCESHNRAEGGAQKSQHLYGRGADFFVQGVNPANVYEFIEQNLMKNTGGLKLYNDRIHIDSRNKKWREK